MTAQPLHRSIQDIGADLQPEIAGGAAIAGDDPPHLGSPLAEHIHMVPEPERHAFERRPPHMGEAMVQPETDQRAARVRIVQRRLLAEHNRLLAVEEWSESPSALRQPRSAARPSRTSGRPAGSASALALAASPAAHSRTIQLSRLPLAAMQPLLNHRPGTR